MTFQYGAEVPEPVSHFKLWCTEGELTALLDADMFPYLVTYSVNEERANAAYAEAARIHGSIGSPYDELWIDALLMTSYFKTHTNSMDLLINQWVTGSLADSAKLYMTNSASNYRNALAFSKKYKGKRPPDKPFFFYELRSYLRFKHNAILSQGNEADDLMSIAQCEDTRRLEKEGVPVGSVMHKRFAKTIIVTLDKDLSIVTGWHYNPNTKERNFVHGIGELLPVWKNKEKVKYEQCLLFDKVPKLKAEADALIASGVQPDMFTRGKFKGERKYKRVKAGTYTAPYIDKLRGTGLKFFYSQLIVGDTVDNYGGLTGYAETAAFELLDDCTTEKELYLATLGLYKEALGEGYTFVNNWRGGVAALTPYQCMLEQGRLAHMQTYPNEIWRAKHFCPRGDDPLWNV